MAHRLDRAQVLAYRAWVQGLHNADVTADLDVLTVGLQDSPAGSAALALRQRTHAGVKLDQPDLVLALTVRGAPHVHRREDLSLVRGALWPRDNEMLRSFLGGFGDTLVVSGADGPALLAQVADELRAIFPGEVATKGELSAAVTPRLPEMVCPWCGSCGTAHVDDGLFRLATLHAGLELVPGEDRRLRFRLGPGVATGRKRSARSDTATERAGAGRPDRRLADLVLAAVRVAGPLTLGDVASWLATRSVTATPQWSRAVWAEIADRLVAVEVDGETLYAAAEMVDAVGDVPAPPVARLLPPRDTYLLGHRGLLVPDRALATQVWRSVGSPGVLVVSGDVAGTWRARKSGRTLQLTVTPRRALTARQRAEVERQADVVAAAREHDGKVVVVVA